jgi:hypothetical protein
MARAFVLAAVLAVSVVSLSAEQAALDPRGNAQFGALRTDRSNDPYRALFTPHRPLPTAPAPSVPKTTIRCGMTILEADPYFDQKMVVVPKDGTKYTIRAVPPPVCGAPR